MGRAPAELARSRRLAEGRIVAAASLADAGDLNGAIAMLSTAGASKALRNPSERHVRQWYLLADLYERAGDVPKAREYFERVFRSDPEAYDVAERLQGLGPERRPRNRSRRTKHVGLDEDGPAPHPRADSPYLGPSSYLRTLSPAQPLGGVVACGAVVVAAGGAGAVVVGAGTVVVVVVGGGAVPRFGPTTVTRVPIGVSGQTSAASA